MILTIDIGKGTEDVMLFQEDTRFENSLQLVYPSMAQLLAQKMMSDNSNLILIDGDTIAGEPWHKEIYRIAKTRKVIMTEQAARSLKYNLNRVRSKNIKIISDDDFHEMLNKYTINNLDYYNKLSDDVSYYKLSDIYWKRLLINLELSNISIMNIENVIICCQDHGEPENIDRSVRDFRIEEIYGKLQNNGLLEDLLVKGNKISKYLPRHRAVIGSAEYIFQHLSTDNFFVMDSSPAVILGAIYALQSMNIERKIILNLGNGHTLVVYVEHDKVMMIYEVHTSGVDADKIITQIRDLLSGRLTHEKVLNSGGHGVFINAHFEYLNELELDELLSHKLFVLGPNRKILDRVDNIEFVHPAGSMMMAGPVGLYYSFLTNKK